jgi:pimeloyl-ACP methyl ester carboxylesterase
MKTPALDPDLSGIKRLLVNGHNLLVEQYGIGNGPAVVLMHHGLGSIKAWRGQIPALVGAGYRVVAYDRWGYGGSDARPALDLPTFATDVCDLHSLIDQLGIKRSALVGHSDGGTLALYFAAQVPQLVSCLVAIAAHVYVELKMEPGILGVQQAFDNDERFRNGLRLAHGDKYEAVFHNWFEGWHRDEFLTWDMRLVLKRINCPALIVQGEEDEHATPQHALDIAAAIPGAQAWIIPHAAHMLPLEDADIFNPELLQFLGKFAGGVL